MISGQKLMATVGLALAATLTAGRAGAHDAPPTDRYALVLVRSTLLALDAANRTGNYAVLRELGSSAFRQANTAGQLAAAFAPHRAAKLDLSAAAVLDVVWLVPPTVEPNGELRLAGSLPSPGLELRFDLHYESSAGAWRTSAVSVTLARPSRSAAADEEFVLRR